MINNNNDVLNIGDEVELIGTGFRVKINGFIEIGDEILAQTYYGDINIDLIKNIKDENC